MKKLNAFIFFCDNCAGQNKNNTIIRFLMSLVEKERFKEVQVLYSMKRYSFMPCYRDFGLIKRTLVKYERLYLLSLSSLSLSFFT